MSLFLFLDFKMLAVNLAVDIVRGAGFGNPPAMPRASQ
jgi:hypothetical protein